MTLVTADECRQYCRQQTTAENWLFTRLLATALASITAYVGRPIATEERTFTDPAESKGGPVRALMIPVTPVASVTSVTDRDGTVVDNADYRLDSDTGMIVLTYGAASLRNGPYVIVAEVGLEARVDYATAVEPIINGALLDMVAMRYQQRNPNASQESEGGGVSVSYGSTGIPQRVCEDLRRIGIMGVA